MTDLKILAVSDPAVDVYVDDKYGIIKDFNMEDVKVSFDIVPWAVYSTNLQKSFEGLLDYDIVMIAGHLWLKDFVDKGYLHSFEYDFSDIPSRIEEEMKIDNQTFLSPSFCDGHMIVYKKDLVKDDVKEILNVDEYIKIVKNIGKKGNTKPLVLKGHVSEIFLDALPFLRSSDEKDILYKEKDNVVCNFENMKAGLEKYLSLKTFAHENSINFGNNELIDAFLEKDTAICSIWSGQLGILNSKYESKDNLGYATFDTAWNVTWSFAITKKCKNKKVAESLLSYLRGKEIDKLVGEYCGCPIRISNYKENSKGYGWYDLQLKMIENAKPIIDLCDTRDKLDIIYGVINETFKGDITVDEAIEKVKNSQNV
ncbi:MAG: ABC transporter substrate-binding protein [Lachnospirales bacterium]